jgi:hypothetical protein
MHSNDHNRDKQGSFQTDTLASVCEQVSYSNKLHELRAVSYPLFFVDQVSLKMNPVCVIIYH